MAEFVNENIWRGTAAEAVREFGATLVGRRVLTPAAGSWPGGWAVVLDLGTDPNAPEIVFDVRLVYEQDRRRARRLRSDETIEDAIEIGVFGYEKVIVERLSVSEPR